MNIEQVKAAKALKRALIKCQKASLGVYAWGDNGMHVCPQPDGREHPEWDHAPLNVCVDIGESMFVARLDCDGGAGI